MAAHPETHDRLIDRDLPCVGCGYNLRGLGLDGVCPECGVAVSRSLAGDWLAAADPKWLAKVVWGQRLLSHGLSFFAWSAVLMFACVIASMVLTMTASSLAMLAAAAMVLVGLAIVLYGGLLAAAVGVFLMTVPEPRESLRESPASMRRLARGAFVAVVVLALIRGTGLLPSLALSNVFDSALGLAVATALAVATVATLTLLAGLALRIPDQVLAHRTLKFVRIWRWLIPTVAAAFLAWQFAASFARSGNLSFRFLFPWISCAVYVLPLIAFVYGIRTLNLLADYRRALPGCLVVAQAGTRHAREANTIASPGKSS